jgi:hypothetical protein
MAKRPFKMAGEGFIAIACPCLAFISLGHLPNIAANSFRISALKYKGARVNLHLGR